MPRTPPPPVPATTVPADPEPPPRERLRAPRDLTDLLNFRLARLLAWGGAPVIRLCEGAYGISRREWHLLGLLAAHGPQQPSALADRSHIDRARVSRALSGLVAKGLVDRQALPGDQRRATVRLSAQGEALHTRLFAEVAAINAALVGVVDPAELAVFDRVLEQLTVHARSTRDVLAAGVQADRWRGSGGKRRWPAG